MRVPHMHDPRPRAHRSVRYLAHRVHESLTTRVSKFICTIVLGLLILLGIITFILWLSIRPHRPRFYIHEFSVPGLAQPNGFQNVRITFNVSARNSNQAIGVYYYAMSGSVYYRDESVGSMPLLFPSYQDPKTTTPVHGELSGATLNINNRRWMEFLADRARGTVVFRLDITSVIRFKISRWNSKRHRMHASCNVAVGPDGLIMATAKDKRCPVYFT